MVEAGQGCGEGMAEGANSLKNASLEIADRRLSSRGHSLLLLELCLLRDIDQNRFLLSGHMLRFRES